MLPLLCTFAIARMLAVTSTPAGAHDDPRAIVHEATRAIENEGEAELRALWQTRLERATHRDEKNVTCRTWDGGDGQNGRFGVPLFTRLRRGQAVARAPLSFSRIR
jgi:hypothetical protein